VDRVAPLAWSLKRSRRPTTPDSFNAVPKTSAGILMYHGRGADLRVLLVHPGGPFWKSKDDAAWSIPKGQVNEGEDLLAAAKREFAEELGSEARGDFLQLSPIKQKSGKIVHAWAVEGNLDTAAIESNTIQIEWPPRSGKMIDVPEVDRADFFDLPTARTKINPAQGALLDELERKITGQH
jgi:predicted NUDIX family NTP pyrophosphohydrolase